MTRSHRTELAIAAWSLRGGPLTGVRALPPESFPGEIEPRIISARILSEAPDEPPFEMEIAVASHHLLGRSAADPCELAQRGPATIGDLAPLERIGAPDGPLAREVIALLRGVRGTPWEVFAVESALLARQNGPLPERVRMECAYLLAVHGERARPLALLEGRDLPPARDEDAACSVEDIWRLERIGAPEGPSAEDAAAILRGARWTKRERQALAAVRASFRWGPLPASVRGEYACIYAENGDFGHALEILEPLDGRAERGRKAGSGDASAAAVITDPVLARIERLDRMGKRIEAIAVAGAHLAEHPNEAIAAAARGIAARLLRGPTIVVAIDDEVQRCVLGSEVTIGRTGTSIALPSPAVSRRHVLLRRVEGRAVVEDLGSHNGTLVAGARIAGAIPIGDRVQIDIAGLIPCLLRSLPAGASEEELVVDLAGERWRVPLGESRFGPICIGLAPDRGEPVVVAHLERGSARLNGDTGASLDERIELSVGDVIQVTTPREMTLRVLPG